MIWGVIPANKNLLEERFADIPINVISERSSITER